MYHLIERIYVETERRDDRTDDFINISVDTGYEFLPQDTKRSYGEQLGFATSLDEFEPTAFFELLREAIVSKKKVIIWADNDTYLRLYTMLVKAIFPKLTLEHFKWIMLCKKATYNTSLTAYRRPGVNVLKGVVINNTAISELFYKQEPLQPTVDRLVKLHPSGISFEWWVARLVVTGVVGKSPTVLKNILRRIALANTHDALDVWGRVVTDPKHWEYAGCDLDTLLDAETVYLGCLNLPMTSNPMFLKPGLFDHSASDEWLCGLLEELIPLLALVGEGPTSVRTEKILGLIRSKDDLNDPEVCLSWIKTMFIGDDRLALPNRDSSKYDENLIRYLLSLPKATLTANMG